jgi:photosystem II stability/assembly factor-like uncharacterized protein
MSSSSHCSRKGEESLLHSCLPLFVSLMLLVGCGQLSSGPTPVSTETVITGKTVPLERIHMVTAKTGWAITSDPSNAHRILHTTAGVNAWQNVTPQAGSPFSSFSATTFFDAVTAWVAAGGVLYHTRNGGQTWEKYELPRQGAGVKQVFFLTQQLGWLLVVKAALTGNMAVELLQSTDGGARWKIISVSNSPGEKKPTAIPFAGLKSGLSFVSPTTGWMTGFTVTSHFPWLYITHDGGVTWHHQDIPLPADAYQVTTIAPTFFKETDGILPVIVPRASGQTVTLYETHDGGAHWKPTMAVPASSFADNIHVLDPMHSWIVSNTFATNNKRYIQSTIYKTIDGGAHWTSHNIVLGADILLIDFVSSTLGWAIDSLHVLYQTTDGGQTWVNINHTNL